MSNQANCLSMNLFMPFKKASLLVPSGPPSDLDRKHLFVIITNPTLQNSEKCSLLVPFSSCKPGMYHDRACIINAGEHHFIRKLSFVIYSKARIECVDKLMRGVKGGILTPHEQVAEPLFKRICDGLTTSRHTPQHIIKFYNIALAQEGS
jgi:hypothetical protein